MTQVRLPPVSGQKYHWGGLATRRTTRTSFEILAEVLQNGLLASYHRHYLGIVAWRLNADATGGGPLS